MTNFVDECPEKTSSHVLLEHVTVFSILRSVAEPTIGVGEGQCVAGKSRLEKGGRAVWRTDGVNNECLFFHTVVTE